MLAELARREDPLLVRSALGAIALARGDQLRARLHLEFTDDELAEMMSTYDRQ